MGLSPNPSYPEKGSPAYDRTIAPSIPDNRGPLRFEEGIATDTSVPSDFEQGMTEGMKSAPGRFNHVNPDVLYKHADKVLAERAHLGSSSWVASNQMLGEFAHGTSTQLSEDKYEEVVRSGGRQARRTPAIVDG
jgi:hypothetical protein